VRRSGTGKNLHRAEKRVEDGAVASHLQLDRPEAFMAGTRGPIEKLTDGIKEILAGVMGALAPQPDVIPVPVRDEGRRPDPRR
jgi:hypothetical protein